MFTLLTVISTISVIKAAAAGVAVGIATGAYKAYNDKKNSR